MTPLLLLTAAALLFGLGFVAGCCTCAWLATHPPQRPYDL